jgi:predicted HicB family RNase H-like nuclease
MRPKSDDFHMRIDPKLKAAGEKAAAADGRSLASLLQKLLADYVAKQQRNA